MQEMLDERDPLMKELQCLMCGFLQKMHESTLLKLEFKSLNKFSNGLVVLTESNQRTDNFHLRRRNQPQDKDLRKSYETYCSLQFVAKY